jgi:hypothetical protein
MAFPVQRASVETAGEGLARRRRDRQLAFAASEGGAFRINVHAGHTQAVEVKRKSAERPKRHRFYRRGGAYFAAAGLKGDPGVVMGDVVARTAAVREERFAPLRLAGSNALPARIGPNK